MAAIQWTNFDWTHYLVHLLTIARKITVCLKSLFHNEFANKYYIGDTCMEPMFWIVDHFTKILGPICVVSVLILMTSMIIIAYTIGLPYWWKQGLLPTFIAITIGHWILINIIFHYYMAYTTLPGYPPQGALIPEAVSICKKCVAPKPPRTHHCSICNVCILKMDHHCPWLNNCIGHFNHRYFFMFCLYVWIGIVFVIFFGIPIAWDHFASDVEISTHLLNSTSTNSESSFKKTDKHNSMLSSNEDSNATSKNLWFESMYHYCIIYAALLIIATFFAVGALLIWHSRLISKGETSIEGYINKKEFERLRAEGKVYENPYDCSPRKNWIIFLGLHSGRWIDCASHNIRISVGGLTTRPTKVYITLGGLTVYFRNASFLVTTAPRSKCLGSIFFFHQLINL